MQSDLIPKNYRKSKMTYSKYKIFDILYSIEQTLSIVSNWFFCG